MPFCEQIHGLSQGLRDASRQADELDERVQELAAGDTADLQSLLSSLKIQRDALGVALTDLRRRVRGLRHDAPPRPVPNGCLEEFIESVSHCIRLERCLVHNNVLTSIPHEEAGDEKPREPWFAVSVGQLLLEILPHHNELPREAVGRVNDWIVLVGEEFSPVLSYQFEGEDQTLKELVIDLACFVCLDDQRITPEAIVALERIAERLEDPALLRNEYERVALVALERMPNIRAEPSLFVTLVRQVARRVLGSSDQTDSQWQRLAKVLWAQGVEGAFDEMRYCPYPLVADNPDEWSDQDVETVQGLATKLAAAFWLALLYRKFGTREDEGRELFCAYVFSAHNYWTLEVWSEIGIDFGWDKAEEDKVRARFKDLSTRLRTSLPLPLTPLIPQIELTQRQIEAVAEAAANSTIKSFVSGGGVLPDLLAASVERDLEEMFSREKWRHLPNAAQEALKSATFAGKWQPANSDFGGAVVLDWKALEIAIDERLVEGGPASAQIFRGAQLSRKMKLVCDIVEGNAEQALCEHVRSRSPALYEWATGFRADHYQPLRIRNNGAHEKPVTRDEFYRSREFVVKFLRALYEGD